MDGHYFRFAVQILAFSDFNIPLLIMFDKNILLDFNIIKHYLSIVYIA